MKTVMIVARDNGYGLSLDADIIKRAFAAEGFKVENARPNGRSLWSAWLGKAGYDLVIHVERIFPRWLNAGVRNWLIPNQERFPKRHLSRLRKVDLVLAKTRHAEAVFKNTGIRTVFSGFTGRDRFDSTVSKNWDSFFHLAGANTLKGTEAVVKAWADNPHWPVLTLVQKTENAPKQLPPNVRLISGFVGDAELKEWQNSCGIHLCPSEAEGWGHHLHEGMSCGSVVLTTDAPPMNEFIDADRGVLVPYTNSESRHLGVKFFVDPEELARKIENLIAIDEAQKQAMGQAARRAFLAMSQQFPQRLGLILKQELKSGEAQ